VRTNVNRFNRADVLRILRISPRQLTGWQRAGLIAVGESFSFYDLIQLKKVKDLRDLRVKPAMIRQSLQAMQKQIAGMENPLLEAGAFSVGSRVAFRHEGHALDPINGQFVMDFTPPATVVTAPNVHSLVLAGTASEFFARGVELEEDSDSYDEAIAAYNKVLEIDPNYAPAHINLGTVYYNQGDYEAAEKHYRNAIACDERYSLAYFDLANVLDETGRMDEAIAAYKIAVQLAPTYADAHYNLALAYQKSRQPRKALQYWKIYIKLDPKGAWAVHARNQIKKILEGEKLKVVYRR
jgi:tetratricopeptide (TPR) repeat protein